VYGFELVRGEARFTGPGTIDVGGRTLRAEATVIATGATPTAPPIPGLRQAGYLTSTTALALGVVPPSLAVIGANAVGLELGQLFGRLGSEVTFLDVADRIAPFEEPEISQAMTAALLEEGARVHAAADVTGVSGGDGGRVVQAQVDGEAVRLPVTEVLVATGRAPNTAGLGLEAVGIELGARGEIVTDEHLRTSAPGVFAAGDCTGAPQFVYVAAYEGALAAENALGGTLRVDLSALPRVTFTDPQIASAGMTVAEAAAAGFTVKSTVLPVSAIPRALVNRDEHGLVKLVADQDTDRLLGASMMVPGAGEVIQSAVLAIRAGLTTRELADTFHPYLTMAEGLKLAAQTFTRDVSRLSCCAA
jgi:mercuric reductase